MIQRFPHHAICAIVLVLLFCVILVPFVSAAAKPTIKAAPTATVPPFLLACSHATYPQANFTCRFPENQSAKIPDDSPYTIKCFDNSSSASDQPIDTWRWEFGDGGASNMQHPEHTYSRAGQYDIRLTVTTWCSSKYSNTTINSIFIYCSVPEPAFTTNVTEGFAPLAVQVTDGSLNTRENITIWTYWFDTIPFSNDRNPVIVYTTPGNHTISQTVWKDCVQIGSTSYHPFIREIKVNPSSSQSSDMNRANTTLTTPPTLSPTTAVTSAEPVATTSPTDTAQSVPEVPGNGTLSVTTEPAGAQLSVDDVLRGTSPATVPDIPAGSHAVRLEKEGYHTLTIPVLINAGKVTGFSTTLTPVSGDSEIMPVIALAVIMLGVAGAGISLYRKKNKK
jgi:PKD repeat protein